MTTRQWTSVRDIPVGVTAADSAGILFAHTADEGLQVFLDGHWEIAESDTLAVADIIGYPFTEVVSEGTAE